MNASKSRRLRLCLVFTGIVLFWIFTIFLLGARGSSGSKASAVLATPDQAPAAGSSTPATRVIQTETSGARSEVSAGSVDPVGQAPGAGPVPDPSGAGKMWVANPQQPRNKPAAAQSTREQAAGGKTVAAILKDADMSDPAVRARVVAEMQQLENTQRKAVEEKARKLGIPLRIEGPGHKLSLLYDFRGDEPIYRSTLNTNAAISSGANLIAPPPYDLNGTGIKVGVWDGGSVRNTHQEFGTRVTKRNSTAANNDHSTHVAGTIGASGVKATAKGMAPVIKIDSYDWNSDYAEMTSAGAATAGDSGKIGLSNHSYGFNAGTADMGRYETEASTVDALTASLPYYLSLWAAGNSQDELTAKGGFQSITFVSLAKNILTVGATMDAVSGGVRNPSAGTITDFSSLGPCDDGRIKPDVVANGWQLDSSTAVSNTSYSSYSGTSMATPSTTGSAALLEQLYAREFSGQRMRASMMKALLIHTADDIGNPGPDYTYGWGLINVKAAADLILAHKSALAVPKMIEGSITNAAKTVTHTFTWDGSSPIRATLCWTDPAGTPQTGTDSRVPNLKHNLDAMITAPDGATLHQPFVMPFVGNWSTASMSSAAIRGKNNVDNVEQVYLPTPTQPGIYTITVSLDGTLTTSNQAYSLIVTGGQSVETNPPPSVVMTSPASGSAFLPGASVTVSADATDKAIGGEPGAVTQVEFFHGTTSLGVDTTAPYSVNWTPPGSGTYSLTAKATDNEDAEATSAVVSMTVLTGNGAPVVSSFTPTSGRAGNTVTISGLNFVNVTSVSFNGAEAEFLTTSAETITVSVPAGATTGPISVTNGYGTGVSAAVFSVTQAPVLISQIYGAGGNTGATYRRDYIELFNGSGISVNLSGWSIQYAAAGAPVWSVAPLSGTIAPGKYHLIGLGTGTDGANLPTVDASGTLNMNASSGKVALMNSLTPISGSSPMGTPGLQDFVGYGAANAYEGTAPAPAPSTTTAAFRKGDGDTDTNDNGADFTVSAPNPRNSTAPAPAIPVVNSPFAAYGVINTLFTYQITASNFPTSYSATNLPAGLSVDADTGVISGVPTAAGNTVFTVRATNAAGFGELAVDLKIYPLYTGNTEVLFTENMGTPAGTTSIASNVFQNSNLTFTGTAMVRVDSSSTTYTGASGGGNVYFDAVVGKDFAISGIDTRGYSSLSLSFGHYKSSTTASTQLVAEYSVNGTNWTNISYTRASGTGTASWLKITPTAILPATQNLRIRFRQTSTTAGTFRIDDVTLTGVFNGATNPIISTSGTPAATNSIYGSPSAEPTSFSVSGVNMTSGGILVTPPPGFEVSLSPFSGFAATLAVGGTGTVSSTPVYLRLAAGTTAGSYAGNVVCTNGVAAPANIPTTRSDVKLKLLTVRANDRSKPFGSTLTLGTGSTGYTVTGLVGSETVGRATLTASGGTAANDSPGAYTITPSNASGGTFDPNNYDFNYEDGTLTVTPQLYADWLTLYPGLADTGMEADPDSDQLSNLMEYFCGYNPETPNLNEITHAYGADTFSMSYRRAKGVGGVTGVVKWSPVLTGDSWSTEDVTETSQDMGAYEIRTATVPRAEGETRKFLRLEVSEP